MPRQIEDRTIDGEAYKIGFMISSDAIKMSTLVSKRLLPAVSKVFSSMGSLKELGNTKLQDLNLDRSLEALAGDLEPEELTSIIMKLCAVVMVQGAGLLEGQAFEEHFKGRPGHALKVAAASFEVNCSDFFGAAVSAAMKAVGSIQAKRV